MQLDENGTKRVYRRRLASGVKRFSLESMAARSAGTQLTI